MIHKSCLGTCGMIPVVERKIKKSLNVLKEYSALRSCGIQSAASEWKSVMYKDGFILKKEDVVLCHGWERYRVHGRVQKSSKAGHLIDHLASRFPLFFPHQLGKQIQLFQAPFSFVFHRVHLFLNQLQGRTQTPPVITSTLQSIQTDGWMDRGDQGFLSSQRFRCSSYGHGAPGFPSH